MSVETLRRDAAQIFRAGVEAADPHAAVVRALEQAAWPKAEAGQQAAGAGGRLRRLHVVAIGKAACSMAEAAASRLSPGLFPGPGIAVVNRENLREVERFRVFESGHPIPDAAGVRAAGEVQKLLEAAVESDTVLFLTSGGGSALLPAPVAAISLEDKVETTRLLLASGADIGEMNTVRKHLSTLKGGGAARLASPARVEALLLSDVLGDDLSTIASGLTAPDPTTYGDAREILERRGVWERAPSSVRRHLEDGCRGRVPETPKPGDALFDRVTNTIVGGNRQSLEAAAAAAKGLGYRVVIASRELTGEAREAGAWLAGFLERESAARRESAEGQPVAILAGGETTVTVRGPGRGGRNQELALSFALAAEKLTTPSSWAFLSGGTDGRDGPTDAAGGLVDPQSLERGRRVAVQPEAALDENDSYTFLEATGDLLRTGATGTNVADLQVLLMK